MKAATQVWLGLALLHRERGRDCDFTKTEIEARIAGEPWAGGVEASTISAHISGHCVGSGRPSPDRDRMLTRTGRGRYRLARPGDPVHPGRLAGRTTPDREDVPANLRYLLSWYEETFTGDSRGQAMNDLIVAMRQSGAWRGVNADDYVRSMREGWD